MEAESNMENNVAVKMEAPTENKETEAVQTKPAHEHPVKKSREEKSRKKDDKSVEQVLKALNSLVTTEEKLAAMCKKYTDIVDENRKFQLTLKQTEKRMSMLQREKEQLQTEHSKAVLTRSRLEGLCRELQRQNKAVKEESLLKIREEEEKRKEVSAKFQSTLAEITSLMHQNNEKNTKLREDNIEMTKKFKTMCEQYELREQQVEKIGKQMQLESQLADAKLAKARMEMAAEKEHLLREKQQLLLELSDYRSKCQELQTTEVNLRSQICLYTDKYDEFQNALSRSNEVFGGFKGEMEKMSKKICKLEKETSSWKQRWENSHQALLDMAADKQQRDGELALATRKLAQLQKLCRTLQAERAALLAQVKAQATSGGKGDSESESQCDPENTEACCDHQELTQSVSTGDAAIEAILAENSEMIMDTSKTPAVVSQPLTNKEARKEKRNKSQGKERNKTYQIGKESQHLSGNTRLSSPSLESKPNTSSEVCLTPGKSQSAPFAQVVPNVGSLPAVPAAEICPAVIEQNKKVESLTQHPPTACHTGLVSQLPTQSIGTEVPKPVTSEVIQQEKSQMTHTDTSRSPEVIESTKAEQLNIAVSVTEVALNSAESTLLPTEREESTPSSPLKHEPANIVLNQPVCDSKEGLSVAQPVMDSVPEASLPVTKAKPVISSSVSEPVTVSLSPPVQAQSAQNGIESKVELHSEDFSSSIKDKTGHIQDNESPVTPEAKELKILADSEAAAEIGNMSSLNTSPVQTATGGTEAEKGKEGAKKRKK